MAVAPVGVGGPGPAAVARDIRAGDRHDAPRHAVRSE
jgi:hypothetical protein